MKLTMTIIPLVYVTYMITTQVFQQLTEFFRIFTSIFQRSEKMASSYPNEIIRKAATIGMMPCFTTTLGIASMLVQIRKAFLYLIQFLFVKTFPFFKLCRCFKGKCFLTDLLTVESPS